MPQHAPISGHLGLGPRRSIMPFGHVGMKRFWVAGAAGYKDVILVSQVQRSLDHNKWQMVHHPQARWYWCPLISAHRRSSFLPIFSMAKTMTDECMVISPDGINLLHAGYVSNPGRPSEGWDGGMPVTHPPKIGHGSNHWRPGVSNSWRMDAQVCHSIRLLDQSQIHSRMLVKSFHACRDIETDRNIEKTKARKRERKRDR